MNSIIKSRNLSTFRFFEQLQLEYIVAELRKKIYPSVKDKGYYKKVMKFKKEKIEDICSRNSLPSIFTDPAQKEELYKYVYREIGPPLFLYRDKKHEEEFSFQDLTNYYLVGSEVKVYKDGKVIIGRIEAVNLEAGLVVVKFESGEMENFDIEVVTRIL